MRTTHSLLLVLAGTTCAMAQQPHVATFAAQPFVVADGERLHAFTTTTGSSTNTTFHQLSRDTGRSWSSPILVTNHPYQTVQPYGIGYAADGDLVGMLYGTGNGPTWVRSLDGGVSWSVGASIRPTATATLGGSLRYVGGVLVAVWTERRTISGEVYASQSMDFGTTWSAEVRIDQVNGPRHHVVADGAADAARVVRPGLRRRGAHRARAVRGDDPSLGGLRCHVDRGEPSAVRQRRNDAGDRRQSRARCLSRPRRLLPLLV